MQTSTPIPTRDITPPITIQDKLSEWLCDNHDAQNFLMNIFFVAQTWDDLIDRDTITTEQDINALFDTMLLTLPLNPFYTKYFTPLYTLLANSIRNWRAANIIENDPNADEKALTQAFVIRSSYIDLIGMCASLIHGAAWGEHVTREARILAGAEGLQGYLTNLAKEKEIRHGLSSMRH